MADEALTIISRNDARALGLKQYCTGVACKHGHASARRVLDGKCIQCIRERQKRHIAQYPELARARSTKYTRAHRAQHYARTRDWQSRNVEFVRGIKADAQRRRRAKQLEAGGEHSRKDVEDIFLLQGGKCAVCASALKVGRARHVDHIQPLSRGGTNDRRNLQLLCRSCNSRKRNKDPMEFMREQGRLL